MASTALVWFRSDLRLDDNPTLAAATDAERVLPLYVIDPRNYGTREYSGEHSFSYRKTGLHRARFRLESLADLRASLCDADSDLLIARGRPEEVVPRIASAVRADVVHCSTYPTAEEVEVEAGVRTGLEADDIDFERHWTHTLHHILDLPDGGQSVADTFTPFKNEVESTDEPRDPLGAPSIPPLPDLGGIDRGEPPSVSDLVDTGAAVATDRGDEANRVADDRASLPFEGGEQRGLDRLETYVWERDRLREYKETRNGLLGADYSSKLSPWLNEGCLSPRRVYRTVKEYERERVANDSTYWLVFELRWRDFFQFQFVKHGGAHFTRSGIRDRTDIDWREDETALERWKAGETGIPFIDAAMRELNHTGYQSNRARQNAASFLANDLRIDWRKGAAYFETQLVDYDPCSNYGNWAYIAGVGNDSRNRSFDVLSQARRYDDDAAYVKTWCPEIDSLPADRAHTPWQLSADEQAEYGIVIGENYPQPLIDPDAVYG